MPEIMVTSCRAIYPIRVSLLTRVCACIHDACHYVCCVYMYVYSMKIKVHLYWAMEVDDLKQRVVATSKYYHYQVHLHVYYSSYKITGVFINGVFFVNI